MHIEALCVGGPDHLRIIDLPAGQRYHSCWDKTWHDESLNFRRSLTLYGLQRVGFGLDSCYLLLDEMSGRLLSESTGKTLYNAFWWLGELDIELIQTFLVLRGKRHDPRPGPPDEVFDDVAA